MSGRIAAIVIALVVASAAMAETLVVYPLGSRDPALGALIADHVARAFDDEYEVYGPAVAPSLVPPLPVGEGFLNPTEFLQGRGVANRVGAALLRDALGASAILTGSIEVEADRLRADLYLADSQGVRSFLATAAVDEPGRLASRIVQATGRRLDSPRQESEVRLDLSASDGELAQALALISAGLAADARRVLESIEEPGERARELLQALGALEARESGADPALLAALAVNRLPLDEPLALGYFQELAGDSELPAANLWVAVLEASINDLQAAERHFAELPEEFTYGQAARAAFLRGGGVDGTGESLRRALESDDVAALVGVAALASSEGDLELEKSALAKLGRVAPYFVYPFERMSFIAFDEGDALTAAEALAVAVELEPESDLYWTNLGWAYYLLGMLERSEAASLRAVALDQSQYVAQYNLGLVRVVSGRLAEADEAYRLALRVDPDVDDAAVEDLEQALELYPDEPAIHYALALLYEAEGRRSEAAGQYRQYLDRGGRESFRQLAERRVEVLSAPPPPIELTDGLVTIGLGTINLPEEPFHPGDPLYPSFEIFTPGEELPRRLEVSLELLSPQGEQVSLIEGMLEMPTGAIGYVVDELEVELPRDLAPGTYRLDVLVEASEGRQAGGSVMFRVEGEPQLIRQLLGRNLMMRALDTAVRLYGPEDISRPGSLPERLLRELQSSADIADEALPPIEAGRFANMTGGELFQSSTASDVRDFLRYLLASGTRDSSFVFVEAYAQWALEGAPSAEE